MARSATEEAKQVPRVAFVVDWLDDSYQNVVLKGAAEVATKHGARLFVLPGGVLGADHEHGMRRNALYRLLKPLTFDAVVSMTGTLTNATNMEVCRELFAEFEAPRVCHVAIEVPGSPSVLVDNEYGVRRSIEHLMRVHGRRNVAFVRGPVSNREAEARYAAYRDALEAQGVTVREAWVAQGDFRAEAGVRAVGTWFEERGLVPGDIDAIVAADDSMALAILEELRKRGIRVPQEIAVIGFDDVPEARFALPPLSSVQQPLIEQGRAAMDIVLANMRGEPRNQRVVLNTLCHFRRSCGCTAEEPGFLTERPKSDTRLSLSESALRRRHQIVEEVESAAAQFGVAVDEYFPDMFFDALIAALRGTPFEFRDLFDVLLESVVERGGTVSAGMDVVSALRRQLSICAGDDSNQIRQVEGLLHEARILTGVAIERAQAQKRLEMTKLVRRVADLASRLSLVVDLQDLADVIVSQLPLLGVRHCLISRYTDPSQISARVVAAVGISRALAEELGWQEYPAARIIPEGLVREPFASHLVVQPLCDGEEHWGFAVFGWNEVDGYVLEVLRGVLSTCVGRTLTQSGEGGPS